jgi:dolichol kinase
MNLKDYVKTSFSWILLALVFLALLSTKNFLYIAIGIFIVIIALVFHQLSQFKNQVSVMRRDFPEFGEKVSRSLDQIEKVIKFSIVYYVIMGLYVVFINPKMATYYLIAVIIFGIVAYAGYEYLKEVITYGE